MGFNSGSRFGKKTTTRGAFDSKTRLNSTKNTLILSSIRSFCETIMKKFHLIGSGSHFRYHHPGYTHLTISPTQPEPNQTISIFLCETCTPEPPYQNLKPFSSHFPLIFSPYSSENQIEKCFSKSSI